ncbi:hypothetical protein BDQ17DRAFT_1466016 [Cyathus striatus]|nr:hypothetical protein BDQ17DRAFT_1466016 [Cyathus striatus]
MLRRRKGEREKDAQRIAEYSQAAPPVKLTNAEQNIINDGTSVAPPNLVTATQTLGATSGHIRCSEIQETESTESEDKSGEEDKSAKNKDESGEEDKFAENENEFVEEDTGNQSKENTANKSSNNSSSNDSGNEFEEEDTVIQSKEDNHQSSETLIATVERIRVKRALSIRTEKIIFRTRAVRALTKKVEKKFIYRAVRISITRVERISILR